MTIITNWSYYRSYHPEIVGLIRKWKKLSEDIAGVPGEPTPSGAKVHSPGGSMHPELRTLCVACVRWVEYIGPGTEATQK